MVLAIIMGSPQVQYDQRSMSQQVFSQLCLAMINLGPSLLGARSFQGQRSWGNSVQMQRDIESTCVYLSILFINSCTNLFIN